MKNIYFFATPNDVRKVLGRFESNAEIKFAESATRSSPDLDIYKQSSEIPDLGISSHETGNLSRGYLVTLRDAQISSRLSTTRTGDRRWTLYNADVEGSVMITPAGVWKSMLLPGSISTVHDDPVAQQLMRWFHTALKAEAFAKAEMWWVGREALHMLDSGSRLSTTAEQSPSQFNLRPEQVKRPPNNSFKPNPQQGGT